MISRAVLFKGTSRIFSPFHLTVIVPSLISSHFKFRIPDFLIPVSNSRCTIS